MDALNSSLGGGYRVAGSPGNVDQVHVHACMHVQEHVQNLVNSPPRPELN
jgi:hypothetical protein